MTAKTNNATNPKATKAEDKETSTSTTWKPRWCIYWTGWKPYFVRCRRRTWGHLKQPCRQPKVLETNTGTKAELQKSRQEDNAEKTAIARSIMHYITGAGGRFLQKEDNRGENFLSSGMKHPKHRSTWWLLSAVGMHCSRIMDCLTMHVQFQSSYLHFSTQSLKKHLLILLRLQPKQSKRVSLPNLLIITKTHYTFSFETRCYNFLSHFDRLLCLRPLNNEAGLHCWYRSTVLSRFNKLYPLPDEGLYCRIAR